MAISEFIVTEIKKKYFPKVLRNFNTVILSYPGAEPELGFSIGERGETFQFSKIFGRGAAKIPLKGISPQIFGGKSRVRPLERHWGGGSFPL